MNKISGGIRSKLKEDSNIKYLASRSQETQQETQHRSRGIEVNGHSLQVEKKFCYLSDTVGARWKGVDSALAWIRN